MNVVEAFFYYNTNFVENQNLSGLRCLRLIIEEITETNNFFRIFVLKITLKVILRAIFNRCMQFFFIYQIQCDVKWLQNT